MTTRDGEPQVWQTSIYLKIARALIEATPESWSSAILDLTSVPGKFGEGLVHSIHNPAFPRDFIAPTDDLFEATRELELAFQERDDPWQRCVFQVDQNQGNWNWIVKYERQSDILDPNSPLPTDLKE